jgi:ribose-phosphate pyrophosphokinase
MHTLTLNLVDSSKSDIKYKISKFPDGQQTVDIVSTVERMWGFRNIQIISRLNSFTDLELIICANQAFKNMDEQLKIELFVPYFLGSRSDRKFVEGGINYLKQVICPIINSQNFSNVVVMDPHSDVLEACLNNYTKINNHTLVEWAINQIGVPKDNICLVSPDAGAYKKIADVAKSVNISNIITAHKTRDIVTGNITGTYIPLNVYDAIKTFVIIDDICDGGRTFIELAKEIMKSRMLSSVVHPNEYGKIYLIITHGIFSAGFDKLNECFDGIFSTDSVRTIGDYVSDSYGNQIKTNLKQLNIF